MNGEEEFFDAVTGKQRGCQRRGQVMSAKPSDIVWGHEDGLGEPRGEKGDMFPGKALVLAQIWRKTSTLDHRR